jgi:hypothetical protein
MVMRGVYESSKRLDGGVIPVLFQEVPGAVADPAAGTLEAAREEFGHWSAEDGFVRERRIEAWHAFALLVARHLGRALDAKECGNVRLAEGKAAAVHAQVGIEAEFRHIAGPRVRDARSFQSRRNVPPAANFSGDI